MDNPITKDQKEKRISVRHTHSAYNMFDFFNAAAPSGKTKGNSFHDPFRIFGSLFSDEDKDKKRSHMPEIPEFVRKALLKYGNRMMGMLSTGRKTIDFDFEDSSEH